MIHTETTESERRKRETNEAKDSGELKDVVIKRLVYKINKIRTMKNQTDRKFVCMVVVSDTSLRPDLFTPVSVTTPM